jgi:iron complex transport system ATP-binding protein
VSLGRHPHTNFFGRITEKDLAVIEWALQSSGAEAYRGRPVDELSDGELQKVMIARALAQEPSLILLDEPAAFLDITRKFELMQLLKRIARDNATAVLVTSHDLELVLSVADRVWLMTEEGAVREGIPADGSFLEKISRSFKLPDFYFSGSKMGTEK